MEENTLSFQHVEGNRAVTVDCDADLEELTQQSELETVVRSLQRAAKLLRGDGDEQTSDDDEETSAARASLFGKAHNRIGNPWLAEHAIIDGLQQIPCPWCCNALFFVA